MRSFFVRGERNLIPAAPKAPVALFCFRHEARFGQAQFSKANLTGILLYGAFFSGTDLGRANPDGAHLSVAEYSSGR